MANQRTRNKMERDPNRLWLDNGDWYLEIKDGRYEKVHDGEQIAGPCGPEVLFQTTLLTYSDPAEDGLVVKAPTIPWFELARHMTNDPSFMFYFARKPRKFEQFVAGGYRRAGYDRVILTPSNADRGKDVIAVMEAKRGLCSMRILDQSKAYTNGKLVRHESVRAMIGVLNLDHNTTKARITTTSDFEPTVLSGDEFSSLIPYRLELINGQSLLTWLSEIDKTANERTQGVALG